MNLKKRRWLTGVAAAVVLLAGAGLCVAEEKEETAQTYCPPGFINVAALGATPDDDTDDTRAFTTAISMKTGIYVPAGTYRISKSLHWDSAVMMGAGVGKTRIVAKIANAEDAILYPGMSGASLRDLTVGYDPSLITGEETEGERAAMMTGNIWAFAMGASIENVCFENVGTGIYSLDGDQYAMFSAALENVSVRDFTFRGFDVRGTIRTGNYFRSIYMTSRYPVDSALYMDGEESETVFSGVVLENIRAREPIHLRGHQALRMSGIVLDHVELTDEGSGYIVLNNTNGTIDSVTVKNGTVAKNSSLFLADTGEFYVNHGKGSPASAVTVRNLTLHNIHSGSLADRDFTFVNRVTGAAGDYVLDVLNYRFTTDHGDEALYTAFASKGQGIRLTLKGEAR